MIEFRQGNMFASPAEVRVNTVNCAGVMGKGIAKQFKDRYPEMFAEYAHNCAQHLIKPGSIHIYLARDGTTIINLATKPHWKNSSQYNWIKSGLRVLRKFIKTEMSEGDTITVPALGCGNGNLKWSIVRKIIEDKLRNLKPTIIVFEPL